jgi:uncharacterized membrane protein
MEKAIIKIILILIYIACVVAFWVLRGRPASLKNEFIEAKNRRNGMLFLAVIVTGIATVIYITN